jgi:two-component system phosphate regulon sensor histidine kinase PhoR
MASRFMLTMVHILRAPVAVLQNSVQLIQKGYVPAEEQPALLERAGQRAGELLTILDDVLLLSQLKEGVSKAQMETVSIAEVLETVLAELKGQADERQITVSVEILNHPAITASPEHIKALWTHLLTNAIRYTNPGGHVTVTLVIDELQKKLISTVSDTGIGVAPEEISRIFEEFYRTEAAKATQQTGTGLGMPIVQHIVSMYGGSMQLESVVSQGSSFRFSLPLSDSSDKGVL